MKIQVHNKIVLMFITVFFFGCVTTNVEGPRTIPDRAGEMGNRRTTDDFRNNPIPSNMNLTELRKIGQLVFSTPFNVYDGLGDGPANPENRKAPGGRLTLPAYGSYEGNIGKGNQFFLRVNGLDSQTCLECHSIVDNSQVPAVFGVGGVGGVSAAAFPGGTKLDSTSPNPVNSDSATYNGRVINPPFVFGSGGVELLGKEMTAALQKQLNDAPVVANKTIQLNTHEVDFGSVFWKPVNGGKGSIEKPENEEVETNCSSIKPAAPATTDKSVKKLIKRKIATLRRFTSIIKAPLIYSDGKHFGTYDNMHDQDVKFVLDTSKLEGVDGDLVIKPFGRKGNNVTTRDFDCGAIRFHMGMEPVEIVGAEDHDGDGVANEVTISEMSALAIFNTTTHRPRQDNYNGKGQQIFNTIGCSGCHIPEMITERRVLPYRQPETPKTPFKDDGDKYYQVDLVDSAHFEPDPNSNGMLVKLFSDLRRHDMGPELKETAAGESDKVNSEFITARLWGLADTAPYLHDGRATTITEAIEWHGGEAEDEKVMFDNLSSEDKKELLSYLRTLHAPTTEQLVIQ